MWLAIALVLAVAQRRPLLLVAVVGADAVAELLTDGLKDAIPRTRPHVHHLVALPGSHSFPSGHTATSFACATVLGGLFPRWRAPLFVLAAAIGYSRLYNGVHWPLDVLAGAVLGSLVGLTALRLLAARRPGSPRARRTG